VDGDFEDSAYKIAGVHDTGVRGELRALRPFRFGYLFIREGIVHSQRWQFLVPLATSAALESGGRRRIRRGCLSSGRIGPAAAKECGDGGTEAHADQLAAIHAGPGDFAILPALWLDAARIRGSGKSKVIQRSARQPAAEKNFFRPAE
jgi:hypothetical protein